MIGFLKNFLSGEKSAEEKAVLAQDAAQKKRDILSVDEYAMGEEDCAEGEEENRAAQTTCCGGGCRG